MKQELSTTTIDQLLPDKFEKYGIKKQKQIIVDTLRNTVIEVVQTEIEQKKNANKIKLLNEKIKLSQEARQLQSIKEDNKGLKVRHDSALNQITGMVKLAENLDLFNSKELYEIMKHAQMIE